MNACVLVDDGKGLMCAEMINCSFSCGGYSRTDTKTHSTYDELLRREDHEVHWSDRPPQLISCNSCLQGRYIEGNLGNRNPPSASMTCTVPFPNTRVETVALDVFTIAGIIRF